MKFRIIFTACLLFVVTCQGYSQLKDSTYSTDKDNYLRKSKNLKTTGLIMLGGGAALAIAGAVMFDEGWESSGSEASVGGIMFLAGGLSMLGSIFPLIESGIYKNKAMKLSAGIKLENARPAGAYSSTHFPAVTARILLK